MITYIMNKDNDKMCEVFDITYDKNGYPRFLVYKDGQWIRMSAKHFRPCTEEDFAKELENRNTGVIGVCAD